MIERSLGLLHKFPHTLKVEVLELLQTNQIQVLFAKAHLRDDSTIFVRERVGPNKIRYSYHWQNKKAQMILRFDNSSHYPKLETYPHHQHEDEKVKSLNDPSLDNFLVQVLRKISR